MWRRDGRELFYIAADGKLMAVEVKTGSKLEAGGATTNLFALPADGGAMRRLTDFGSRSVLITRRISWSPDSKYIYAAVADVDSDVVLLDGLLR